MRDSFVRFLAWRGTERPLNRVLPRRLLRWAMNRDSARTADRAPTQIPVVVDPNLPEGVAVLVDDYDPPFRPALTEFVTLAELRNRPDAQQPDGQDSARSARQSEKPGHA